VEIYSEDALPTEELEGIFLALDGDFNTYTRVFVGAFYPVTSDFTTLLQEEQQLFLSMTKQNLPTKCCDLKNTAIHYFATHLIKESMMMRQLAKLWFEDDVHDVILALWKNQGNVSSAAKDLFMHRNTLQYKIDKFQKQTLTNLKEMDSLFLCYLLLTTFAKN
jgi:sugar diacid utilization regulator